MESSPQKRVLFQDLVRTHGSPLYVYDGQIIADRVSRLKRAFGGFPHKLHYAAKALSNLSILRLIRSLGCGLDAVSIQEVQLGFMAGFEPDEILFTPNNVPFVEIEQAVGLGVHVNLDSLSAIRKFGETFGNQYPVFIRLNPHILAGGNPKIQTGHIDSKFGISIFQLNEIESLVNEFDLNVEGIHIHTGSEFLDPGVFLQGADILFKAAAAFPRLRYIDFGSGFKVPYKKGDVVTPIEELGEALEKAVGAFNAGRANPVEIWFEPGKFLVSEAGTLLCTVNTVKKTPVSAFLGVDTGLNHLIRPMMYDAFHEIENISVSEDPNQIYNIVGYICETDTLGYSRSLPVTSEGDILAIHNAGAYGFSMASQYNSRFRPAEILLWKDQAVCIRRRESMEDLLRGQLGFPGLD
jgi:diaminopimelate decarboxylase